MDGSEKLATRLAAIYALERIAKESRTNHWPIMETLAAFVRDRQPWTEEKSEQEYDDFRAAREMAVAISPG